MKTDYLILDKAKAEFSDVFSTWLNHYKDYLRDSFSSSAVLADSEIYSLNSGGKRFRPFLTYLVMDLFASSIEKARNYMLSLELVHTYSLIHDDLPCMDNDDFRRGVPTNHKVFSESVSLLAGDGLLTDAFYLIASDSNLSFEARTKLIELLSAKIGSRGMVAGQVLDMKSDAKIKLPDLIRIHELKTANLIQAAAEGAAIIAQCSDSERANIVRFSYHLGMAFQIKDDLLDATDVEQDFKNFVSLLGANEAEGQLRQHTEEAKKYLAEFDSIKTKRLMELIEYNFSRGA